MEKEIINANNSRMMWADQYLNELIQQVDSLFYALQTDKQLMDGLYDIDSQDADVQFNSQKYIIDRLYSVFYANSQKVDDLTLYIHSNRKAFSASFATSVRISTLDIQNGVWSRILVKPVDMYFKQSDSNIYVFHSLNRYLDSRLFGGLSVQINKKVWEEVGAILKSEFESSIFIINDEGEVLSGSTRQESAGIHEQLLQLDLPDSDLKFRKTEDYFFFMKRVDQGQLTIVKAIPFETVTRSARATMTAGILTSGIFAVVSIMVSILLSLKVSRPIISLAKTMQTAQVNEFKMKQVKSRDEIGLLERGYNTLMQRIKELIENEYRKNIELKNTQFMALQAQINPHFLNNTLNLIGGMALSKNAPEIYQITRTIGDLLRYSISTDGDTVTLEDELRHMQNYIFIQERRFAGRCSVNISTDPNSLERKLPRFTLQPIVENAFEHGLQQKEGAWKINIRISRIAGRIVIAVKDNGVGLSEERLRQVREELHDGFLSMTDTTIDYIGANAKRRGIGLRNVNARLKLQYGPTYGARIFSRQGEGTIVVLILPAT